MGPALAKFLMKAKSMAEPVAEGAMGMGRRGMAKLDEMPGTKGGILGLLAGAGGASMLGGGDGDGDAA